MQIEVDLCSLQGKGFGGTFNSTTSQITMFAPVNAAFTANMFQVGVFCFADSSSSVCDGIPDTASVKCAGTASQAE